MARDRKTGKVEPIQKIWLSAQEAKDYLGCSLDFLEELRNRSEVRFSQFGSRKIWYELASINRFLERHRVV